MFQTTRSGSNRSHWLRPRGFGGSWSTIVARMKSPSDHNASPRRISIGSGTVRCQTGDRRGGSWPARGFREELPGRVPWLAELISDFQRSPASTVYYFRPGQSLILCPAVLNPSLTATCLNHTSPNHESNPQKCSSRPCGNCCRVSGQYGAGQYRTLCDPTTGRGGRIYDGGAAR